MMKQLVIYLFILFPFSGHTLENSLIQVESKTTEVTITGQTPILQSESTPTVSPDDVWTFNKPFFEIDGVKHYINDNATYGSHQGACATVGMEFAKDVYDSNRNDGEVINVRDANGISIVTVNSNGSVFSSSEKSDFIIAYTFCRAKTNE